MSKIINLKELKTELIALNKYIASRKLGHMEISLMMSQFQRTLILYDVHKTKDLLLKD